MMARDAAHDALNEATLLVVDGVKGDVTKHGANSPLYKAMGYVPRSERSSGLTRKTATGSTGTTTTQTVGANDTAVLALETGTEYTPEPAPATNPKG